MPANGDGISMEAFSDSTTTSRSSTATRCPAATATSMTDTFSASPMSGTRISMRSAAGDDGTAISGVTGGGSTMVGEPSAVPASTASSVDSVRSSPSTASIRRIESPELTTSPSDTSTWSTVPVNGAGTSMDALSDSMTMSASFSATASPGATQISMTSTSSASPMSGMVTSIRTASDCPCPGRCPWRPSRPRPRPPKPPGGPAVRAAPPE